MKLYLFLLAALLRSHSTLAQSGGVVDMETACVNSNGTVVSSSCCQAVDAFPNTCVIGACGCAPDFSHNITACECPPGSCFDGNTCTPADGEPPMQDPTMGDDPLAMNCEASGGTVGMSSCCESGNDFPNTCAIGACGCAPEFSRNTSVCECPPGSCFDGTTCVPNQVEVGSPPIPANTSSLAAACLESGGIVEFASCCANISSYPDLCLRGACGCLPDPSIPDIEICTCPEGSCFNGTACTSDDSLDGGIASEAPTEEVTPTELVEVEEEETEAPTEEVGEDATEAPTASPSTPPGDETTPSSTPVPVSKAGRSSYVGVLSLVALCSYVLQ